MRDSFLVSNTWDPHLMRNSSAQISLLLLFKTFQLYLAIALMKELTQKTHKTNIMDFLEKGGGLLDNIHNLLQKVEGIVLYETCIF